MAGWKDVLNDLAAYPDSVKIKIAEGVELPLGELRDASKADLAALDKQRKEMTERQKEIDAATLRVAELYSKGQLTTEQVADAAKAVTTQPPAYDYEADQYVGPVFKKVKTLEDTLGQLKQQNDLLRQQLGQINASMTTDHYAREYEGSFSPEELKLLDSVKHAIPSFDDVVKHAQTQGFVDPARRVLNVRRAAQDLIREPLMTAKLKAEREAGKQEGAQEQARLSAAASVPRSGRVGRQKREIPTVDGKQIKTLDDAMEAASEDVALMNQLGNIGSIQ